MSDRLILASAPTRIDFAGGTLDIPPLFLFHQPALTVNVAIDLCARVQIRTGRGRGVRLICRDQGREVEWPSPEAISWARRPFLELVGRLLRSFPLPPGCEVITDCEAPAGAGTGGSSALAVALTAALARLGGERWRKPTLIEHAKGVETQAIKVPTGYQDYYAAAYGGVSGIEYTLTGVLRRPLASAAFMQELERHLLLVYTGRPRFSGANNWRLFVRHIEGEGRTIRFFDDLQENALAMREAFVREDIRAIGRLMRRDWGIRRRLLPSMSTPRIEAVMRRAAAVGAWGARVCGAGGGGCVAFVMDPAARERVRQAVEESGVVVFPVRIHRGGVQVRERSAAATAEAIARARSVKRETASGSPRGSMSTSF